MSFKCQMCRIAQPNRTRPQHVVIESRIKHYRGDFVGSEIVREITVCDRCAVAQGGN